ncbi:hypothetical protein C8F04DRAFT_1267187 [Mycena alexandri]|uniref:Uncharacterized protein n=1 Tax=Mycena alexandri TaxID=1745969 RepID=A0AAD6WXS1_9AGAR|nr:hypothetical protein C8F04DRAFT_1267187 [Mycena alexandri]
MSHQDRNAVFQHSQNGEPGPHSDDALLYNGAARDNRVRALRGTIHNLRVTITSEPHRSQVFLRTLENNIRGLLGVASAMEGTFPVSRRELATLLNVTRAVRLLSSRIGLIFPQSVIAMLLARFAMLWLENDSAQRSAAAPMVGALAYVVHRARFVMPQLHIHAHKEIESYLGPDGPFDGWHAEKQWHNIGTSYYLPAMHTALPVASGARRDHLSEHYEQWILRKRIRAFTMSAQTVFGALLSSSELDVLKARVLLRHSISRFVHHLHLHKTQMRGRQAITRSQNILKRLNGELDLAWKVYGEAEMALQVLVGQ